jgi:outer membrane protein TolC
MMRRPAATSAGIGVLASLLLAGCASFSSDGGFNAVASAAKDRLGKDLLFIKTGADREEVAKRTRALVAKPLTMDDAVQIALLNNRGLQAAYSELGLSEADVMEVGRLPNPGFTFSRTRASSGDLSIARAFSTSLLSILTLPFAAKIEGDRFEQTKLETADAMMKVALDAQRMYIVAVAEEQDAKYSEQVRDAADAAAELARRMRERGSISRLDDLRAHAFYAEAVAQLATAREEAVSARERLARALGVWGADAHFELPNQLPDLPQTRLSLADLEQYAMANRLDIAAARLETKRIASSFTLGSATRFVNVIDGSYLGGFETDKGRTHGFEIRVEIPIFDLGRTKITRSEALYGRAVNRLAEAAIDARSEAREAYEAYQTSYDVARHYRDQVVPLRKAISEEMVLRYNGMLASVFDLLTDAREQADAVRSSIDALKRYWLAETDLQQALGGRLPDSRHEEEPGRNGGLQRTRLDGSTALGAPVGRPTSARGN